MLIVILISLELKEVVVVRGAGAVVDGYLGSGIWDSLLTVQETTSHTLTSPCAPTTIPILAMINIKKEEKGKKSIGRWEKRMWLESRKYLSGPGPWYLSLHLTPREEKRRYADKGAKMVWEICSLKPVLCPHPFWLTEPGDSKLPPRCSRALEIPEFRRK